ncbi:MAG: hypothetical protein U1E05_10270 [Patescibacteria group bacterium]|nr:hypothetical protein [Patescibacteria group bacterium]
MPIRFHCKRCDQLLGIASRKIGNEIECPKCGLGQIVPSEEAAAAAAALRLARSPSGPVEADEDFAVYDDAPEPVAVAAVVRREKPTAAPTEPTAPPTEPAHVSKRAAKRASATAKRSTPRKSIAAPPVSTGPEPAEVPRLAIPGGMILFPRRTLYVQGVLVVVLALVFFGTGYFIGRGNATLQLAIEHEASLRERTLIEGRLVYRSEPQELAGDERAVIIALPASAGPVSPISIHGLRPQDPDPPQSLRSLQLLDELGAVYGRANAEGRFDTIVPDRGEYYILLISRNAGRPQGTQPDEGDMLELGRYFITPERLVSRYKYRWSKHDVHGGMPPIEIDFGEDGKE